MHKAKMITQMEMTALLFQMNKNGNVFLKIGRFTISHTLINMRNLQQR